MKEGSEISGGIFPLPTTPKPDIKIVGQQPSEQEHVPTAADRDYKCIACGCFSSTRYCWHCSTTPQDQRFAALQAKVIEYLRFGSIDGKPERQRLRKELAQMVGCPIPK